MLAKGDFIIASEKIWFSLFLINEILINHKFSSQNANLDGAFVRRYIQNYSCTNSRPVDQTILINKKANNE